MSEEGRENKESRSLCVITLLWRQQNIAVGGGEVRWSLRTYTVFGENDCNGLNGQHGLVQCIPNCRQTKDSKEL